MAYSYRNNLNARKCSICTKNIAIDDWTVDLFRHESAHSGHKLEWAHLECVVQACERWVKTKEQKAAEAKTKEP